MEKSGETKIANMRSVFSITDLNSSIIYFTLYSARSLGDITWILKKNQSFYQVIELRIKQFYCETLKGLIYVWLKFSSGGSG